MHLLWDGGLLAWAVGDPAEAPARRGRRPAALPHPFAHLPDVAGGAGTRVLQLPSSPRAPLPAGVDGPLLGWDVPVVLVADPLGFLLDEPHEPWTSLARFAIDLVARGRVLPAVRGLGSGRAEARWVPLVTGEDAVWLRSLADLPGVAQACDALVDLAARARLVPVEGDGFAEALTRSDASFACPDVAALQDALTTWQADAVQAGDVRGCFRLVEPTDDDPAWHVDLALQAVQDPSLVVDAADVWRGEGAFRTLARYVEDPAETLLTQLGRAVRLYPALAGALRTAEPTSLALDADGAFAFLSDAAPVLLAAGFGVLLPGWWTHPSRRLGAKLHASTPVQPGSVAMRSALGVTGIVDFSWQLAVGEHTLTDDELDDLVEAQTPLVKVRGQWLHVDAARLASARTFLAKWSTSTVLDVLRVIGGGDGPGGLPVADVQADGWLGDLLAGSATLEPMTAPPGFQGSLRPYQERGLAWMAFLERCGLGGVLADDMGLGKTVQLLALFASGSPEVAANPGEGPTLLVCPMSLVGNWEREAAKFAPGLRVLVHHGPSRLKGLELDEAVNRADLVVTTYGLVAREPASLATFPWRRIVLDEAQAIKNAASRAAVAVRSLPSSSRLAVTGTPVENRLADLWSLMEFANPGLLGTATEFKRAFATPVERHGDVEATARLKTLTQPFVLRRLKTDTSIISDLPAKLEMDVLCSLTAEQASLYQAVVDDMLHRIETSKGIERRGLVLATMTKLKQVCNHPAQFLRDGSPLAGRSGKLERVDALVDEIRGAGEKVLLFTQYAEFGAMLAGHLGAAYLHGGLSKLQRDSLVARFQSPAGPSVFVLSLKAGGTGLTLTAANHVIHVDRWWNPAVEDQATDRAFRIGQKKNVQVRKLMCAGTLEEKVATMITSKRQLASSVVGTGEGWLTELSTDDLRAVLELTP